MTGAGHSQVFLSLSLLRINLASFSETSVIMDTGAVYYSVSYPQGHLPPYLSLAVLAVPQESRMLHFAAGVHREGIKSAVNSPP